LNVEDVATLGEQRGKLAGLNATDFDVVIADAKNRSLGRATELRDVTGFAI
jgi:hypothetical protein